MNMTKKEIIIKAIGKEAYHTAKELIKDNAICPYDEAFSVQEMLEETNRCLHCFVRQCPINK